MNKTIKYGIIAALAAIIISIGYNWHNSSVESAIRNAIASKMGENKILMDQILAKQKEAELLIKSRDSAISISARIKHDTILIYGNHEGKIKIIGNLGTNSSIDLLSKRLAQENTNR